MADRRRAFQLLARALVDPAALTGNDAADSELLMAMAAFHRVEGQLASSYARGGVEVPPDLQAVRQTNLASHLQKLKLLEAVGAAFDAAGIPWVVLKGPVLATRWYADPAARTYHDLDLLVASDALREAIDVLAGLGLQELNRNWTGFRSVGLGEVPLTDDTVVVDLHWHVVALERDRRALDIPTAALLDRRIPQQLGSVHAWSLDDQDMLVHTVLHALLNGGRLLLHLRDAHLIGEQVAGAASVDRLRRAGLGAAASVIFDRASRYLGPLTSPGLVTSLGHPGWRTFNSTIDRAWGAVLPGAANAVPSAFVMASRDRPLATVNQLARSAGTAAGARLGRGRVTDRGGPLDFSVDAGGWSERDRFLRDVEAGRYGC